MTATLERRTLPTKFEVRSAPAGHKIIEGYAAKYDRYSENLGGFVEVVRPGFFDRAMRDERTLGRYNHHAVLARIGAGTLRLSSDTTGLGYEIDVNPKDPEAVSVLAKVERGDVCFSSFAFSVTRDGDAWGETEQGFPLRELVAGGCARLHDVAPVDEPAYPDTESGVRMARCALRSFAEAVEVDPKVIEAAAEQGDLIDLIRGARNLEPSEPPAEPTTAAAPAVLVRLELERLAARRRAHLRPR
ncbi:MAG TPA: HK97 family phage prohead protease [Acidimicrobiales bacterium]|nr:HK97 family phage prohead protease [Acidimicrobiales bacterium]